jgi:hypothetical protein
VGQASDYNAWAACLTDDRLIVVVLTNDDYNSGIFEVGGPLGHGGALRTDLLGSGRESSSAV